MQLTKAAYKLVLGPPEFWLSTPYGMVCFDDVDSVGIVFDEMRLDLEYGPPLDSEPDHMASVRSLKASLESIRQRLERLPHPSP